MDRPSLRYGYGCGAAALFLLAAVLSAAGGCQSALATAMYIVKGNNIEAQYEGLKDKKVAVVCRPVAALTYRNSSVARDLACEIGRLLESNVRRIEVIPHRKVVEWLEENSDWSDYTEIGKALGADMVVAIDLQSFTIYEGQTLYQGKANVELRVYDCRGDGKVVFEKELPRSVYPPNAVVETSKKAEREFRREYVAVLADQIGRHFYPHDAHADYALDTVTLE